MVQNGPKRSKTFQNDPKRFKTVQNGPKQPNIVQLMVENGPKHSTKRSKTVQNGSKWLKTGQNGPKRCKTLQNVSNRWSKRVEGRQNGSKRVKNYVRKLTSTLSAQHKKLWPLIGADDDVLSHARRPGEHDDRYQGTGPSRAINESTAKQGDTTAAACGLRKSGSTQSAAMNWAAFISDGVSQGTVLAATAGPVELDTASRLYLRAGAPTNDCADSTYGRAC